jgi:hypothetical protein
VGRNGDETYYSYFQYLNNHEKCSVRIIQGCARFEVFMAVKHQVKVFWVVKPCSVAASIFNVKMEAARSPTTLVSYHSSTWCHNL